ncbi:MAG TPA: PEGA domain-containing protein [Polyangiaceae bacterium]|nr:PEGA domain-containing protein [Polyangiaceae bacterium]
MGEPKSLSKSTFALCLSALSLIATAARAQEPSGAQPSGAQEPSAADRSAARTLAQEGYVALSTKDYATAIDRYKRALSLVRAPTLLRDLARAQVGLGHLVEAHENYTTIIREGVAADAPPPWVKAVSDAKSEIATISPRLAWLTITVGGPAHPKVTIDGAPIGEGSLDVKRPEDPGRHEIRAMAQGYYTAKKTVSLKEGESVKIAFELEDAPPDAAPKDEEATGSVSVATVIDPPWRKPVTIGAFALGGAGIVVGSITGIMAMSKHNKLAADCRDKVCYPAQKSDYDAYHTLGMVSTIGFVAGGVGVGAGALLLLLKPQSLVQQPSDQGATKAAVSFTPFVGIGSAGVEGTF